jgi:hypothetical protein
MSSAVKWLSDHVFIASWLSVLIALVAMLRQAHKSGQPIKWNSVVLRLGFLICLSAVLTPSVDHESKVVLRSVLAITLGALIVRPE